MARIGKAEHVRILQLVDRDGRKVAEVAAEYGCTPGNIYALLGRLRRGETPQASPEAAGGASPDADPPDAASPRRKAGRRGAGASAVADGGGPAPAPADDGPDAPTPPEPPGDPTAQDEPGSAASLATPGPREALALTPPEVEPGRPMGRTAARSPSAGARASRERTPADARDEAAPDDDLFAAAGAPAPLSAPPADPPAVPPAAPDADTTPDRTGHATSRRLATPVEATTSAPPAAKEALTRTAAATAEPARPTRAAGRNAPVGARLAKTGFGLVMRMDDGEESLTPFRSLEDLLSAVKPILRTASRSADPVWFSIRPVDLASVDSDGD